MLLSCIFLFYLFFILLLKFVKLIQLNLFYESEHLFDFDLLLMNIRENFMTFTIQLFQSSERAVFTFIENIYLKGFKRLRLIDVNPRL